MLREAIFMYYGMQKKCLWQVMKELSQSEFIFNWLKLQLLLTEI